MTGGAKLRLFFEGQRMHFAVLVVVLAAVWGLTGLPGFGAGEFLGLSTRHRKARHDAHLRIGKWRPP